MDISFDFDVAANLHIIFSTSSNATAHFILPIPDGVLKYVFIKILEIDWHVSEYVLH